MSTYLVALIAGPYARWDDAYTDEHGEIPLGLFCRASLAEFMDAERLFTETKQGFDFYHQQLRRAVRVRQVRPAVRPGVQRRRDGERRRRDVPGGLRLPQQGDPGVLRAARRDGAARDGAHVVRRPGHHDSGGTTCGSTSRSRRSPRCCARAEATEYTEAWTTFANVEKSWAYRQDQLPSTHPVAADIPDLHAVEVNFDGITYAKGASVLKQLVAYVGLEQFLAGLRDYFRDHAFDNATFGDLLGRAGEVVGPRPVATGVSSG